MKIHKGMRPQDLVVLLKIASLKNETWYAKDLAYNLKISQSEISESLNRSKIAGLLARDKKTLVVRAILDFLFYGFKYVYPGELGAIQRGMPTAHSAPPLNNLIESNEVYVWPWAEGSARGQSIEPLYASVPEACKNNLKLYELLALTDALRIGRVREQQLAIKELKKRFIW